MKLRPEIEGALELAGPIITRQELILLVQLGVRLALSTAPLKLCEHCARGEAPVPSNGLYVHPDPTFARPPVRCHVPNGLRYLTTDDIMQLPAGLGCEGE